MPLSRFVSDCADDGASWGLGVQDGVFLRIIVFSTTAGVEAVALKGRLLPPRGSHETDAGKLAAYRGYGFSVVTYIAGTAARALQIPWVSIPLFAAATVIGGLTWAGSQLRGGGSEGGRSRKSWWGSLLLKSADVLTALVLVGTIFAVLHGTYAKWKRGITLGFEMPNAYSVKVSDYKLGTPQTVELDFSMFYKNDATEPLGLWMWSNYALVGADIPWKHEWATEGSNPVDMARTQWNVMIPATTPTTPFTLRLIFHVGHSDKARFLKELESFPGRFCLLMDYREIRQKGSEFRDYPRHVEYCSNQIKLSLAEAYQANGDAPEPEMTNFVRILRNAGKPR